MLATCCNAHEHAVGDLMAAKAEDCGFDYLFIETLSERLICPVCQMAMKEPKLTECGHQFCAGCLIRYSHGQTFSCPVCRTTLDSSKIYPNNALKREILDLKIKCVRHESCDWVGELRNEEVHEGECQYVNEYCTNECGELVMRKDMGDHVDNQCSRRRVRCVHCN